MRLKTRRRIKDSRRPFPTISYQVGNAEGAITLPERTDRNRIPLFEIEVAMRGARRCVSPWMTALGPIKGPKCRAVKLGFGGQRPSYPSGIRCCLHMAHINGPGHGQGNQLKHGAV